MPAKRIHTDRLDGVRSSYMDMSEVLAASADFIGAGDASREKLAATTTKVQDVSRHIADVVDAMDSYLNSVAVAFREQDAQLASTIQQNYRLSDEQLRLQGKQGTLAKDNHFYPLLP